MRIVTFGEVLLRFSKDSHMRLSQGNVMNANFGGSEANAAVSLAMLGNDVRYVTCLPNNDIGKACKMRLQELGLDTKHIHWGGERMGTYYFEDSVSIRSPRIVYDRKGSAFYSLKPGMIDWQKALRGWMCSIARASLVPFLRMPPMQPSRLCKRQTRWD